MQLEFFPRKELNSLSDFYNLENASLSLSDLKEILIQKNFFSAPKNHEVIKVKHARIIDNLIGFRTQFYEEMLIEDAKKIDPYGSHETWGPSLCGGVQSWVGLDVDTLQTPYADILKMLQMMKLKPFQTVVDLGAAYGRMGVVIGALYVKSFFIGHEYIKARVEEGNRIFRNLDFNKCRLEVADLSKSDYVLPEADIFFIYDFGDVEHIQKILFKLQHLSKIRHLKIGVKGKFTKELISKFHPWMELVFESTFNIYIA